MSSIRSVYRSESGVVSILVSMIMMIVITLVVLGFSQLSRNESTQALNRQLTTEAFYAANSALNNAAYIIRNAGGSPVAQNTCTGTGTYTATQQLSPSSAGDVSYTCVTVNPTPNNAQVQLAEGQFKAFPVQATDGTTSIGSITISWSGDVTNLGLNCPSFGTFPAAITSTNSSNWKCDPALLQVDIISAADSDTLAGQSNVSDMFLYPQSSPSTTPDLTTHAVNGAQCTGGSSYTCSITITTTSTINSESNQLKYYLRVMPLYKATNVTVAANVSGGVGIPLLGAVAQVDATGRAKNILQRLSAQIPLTNNPGVSSAIQTGGSVCKYFETYASDSTVPSGAPTDCAIN